MSATPYRILVVDDTPQNVELAQACLEAQGYVVDTGSDGREALDAAARHVPDLILLDVMMPGMDGFEATRRLKAGRETRHVPVVLLTSLTSTEDRVTGIEAGADDFISKPFDRTELVARVRSLVRVKRLEETERARVRQTLERYVDSSVAQQLLDSPDLAVPGGRRQDASALFVDIRGFSGWSEREEPEAVLEVINALLQVAVEAVFRHGGMVDKFMGDGLMALFGAPVPCHDHLHRAVAAALDIRDRAGAVAHPRLTGPLRVGCGVNAGEMVVGNVGSERRLDYTAVGNAVNVAKRLEEDAEPGQVLVTESCRGMLGGAEATSLGERILKGQTHPVRVYDVTRLACPAS